MALPNIDTAKQEHDKTGLDVEFSGQKIDRTVHTWQRELKAETPETGFSWTRLH